MRPKSIFFVLFIFIIAPSVVSGQKKKNDVTIIGEMKNVMWKGQLEGIIHLDTIADKKNLYGFGPVEFLSGEILIVDGSSYRSTVFADSLMKVDETYDLKAPFFAYANIKEWKEEKLRDDVRTISDLEEYLDEKTTDMAHPFLFKLSGMVDEALIHIVNLPEGSIVKSPEEAHRGLVHYRLENEKVDIVGFFSKKHQAIFTHHDTWLHMHLITTDRKKMGHLDEVRLSAGKVKLYLPTGE